MTTQPPPSMLATPASTTTFTPSSICFGSSIYGGFGTMTLGDPSNIPACYPSGLSTFSPGTDCPSGWSASITSTVSGSSYEARCCPIAALAESIPVVWMPNYEVCSFNVTPSNLVTHGWVIQTEQGTYSIYEGLTMGHLEANPILLRWRDVDVISTTATMVVTSTPAVADFTTPTGEPTQVGETRTAQGGGRGLGKQHIIAISITLSLLVLLLVGIAIWGILRYRKNKSRRRHLQSQREKGAPEPPPKNEFYNKGQYYVDAKAELAGDRHLAHELDTHNESQREQGAWKCVTQREGWI